MDFTFRLDYKNYYDCGEVAVLHPITSYINIKVSRLIFTIYSVKHLLSCELPEYPQQQAHY